MDRLGPGELGSMSGAVLTLAAYDGNVLAIDDAWQARLFTADGRVLDVSRDATPYRVFSGNDIMTAQLPEGR